MFCELAISDLSCRIGDSLSREAHESPQKITDAIYEVTTGPRPTGYFLFSVRCTNHVRVVLKWFTKRMGRSQRLLPKPRLCLVTNLLVCWDVRSLSGSLRLLVRYSSFIVISSLGTRTFLLLPSYLDTFRLLKESAPGRGRGPGLNWRGRGALEDWGCTDMSAPLFLFPFSLFLFLFSLFLFLSSLSSLSSLFSLFYFSLSLSLALSLLTDDTETGTVHDSCDLLSSLPRHIVVSSFVRALSDLRFICVTTFTAQENELSEFHPSW